MKKKKKLMQAKYVALPASLPSGLNKIQHHMPYLIANTTNTA